MAQDTKPATPNTEPDDEDGNFHYYSGGEVKELANTRVAPILWGFYGVLVLILLAVVVSYFTGNRTPTGLTRPAGLLKANQMSMQSDLDATSASRGFQAQDQLDIARIQIPQGETIDQAIDKGADVYQTYCIGCHGQNQDGNGVNAASLNPKPRNLRDAPFMQAMSYQRIYTSVHKGVPGTAMPRWENSLSEDQMRNAIAYVLSLSAPKPGSPEAAAADTLGQDNTVTPSDASTPSSAPVTAAPATAPVTAAPSTTVPATTAPPAPAATNAQPGAAPTTPGTASPGQPGTKPANP